MTLLCSYLLSPPPMQLKDGILQVAATVTNNRELLDYHISQNFLAVDHVDQKKAHVDKSNDRALINPGSRGVAE